MDDWRLLTFVIYCFASFALGLVFILPNGSQILQNTHYAVEASSILLSFIMVCMYFSKFGLLGLCKDCRNFLFVIEIASAPSNLKVRLALKSKVIFIAALSLYISNLRYVVHILNLAQA